MIRGHIRSLRDFGVRANTLPREVVIRYLSKFGSMRLNKARARLEKEMEDFHPSDVRIMRRIISAVISHADYMRPEVRQIIIDTLSSCMENNNTWKGGLPSLRTRLEREELYWEYELECSEDDDYEAQGLFSIDVHHKISVPFLTELLEKLGEVIPAEKHKVLQKMVLNIGAILYCESKEALYLAIANIVSELVDVAGVMRALLKKINFEYLYQLIAGVVKFLSNPDAYEAQSSYSGNQMDIESFGALFRILAAGYAFIFDKQAAAMSTFSLEWQQKLFSAYRNTSCIPELYNFFVLFMRSTYEFVQVHVLGNDVDHDGTLVQLDATYEDWKKNLFVLEALMDDVDGSIHRNPETRRKIIQNHEIGIALNDIIEVQKTITRGAYSHFQALFAKSAKMATLARQAGTSSTFRAPPYMLQICGSSGIGKSTCLERLAMYLNEYEPVPYEEGGLLFTRQTSSKYWEGYHSQLAVVYDDLFQTTEPINRAETANEIINVCNSVPLSLNMAELSAKGNVMFNSKFVFCTTNVWEERSIGLAHIQAFWRRFGSRWKFSYPREFMSNDKPDWNKMAQAHPEMDSNELMYELMECQLVSDQGTETMKFMEFCEYVRQDSHKKFLHDNIALQKNREFVRTKLGDMRKDAAPKSVEVTDSESGATATIDVVEAREAQGSTVSTVRYELNQDQMREQFGHDDTTKLRFGKINYAVSEVVSFLHGVKSIISKKLPSWSFQQWSGQYVGRILSKYRKQVFPEWAKGEGREYTFGEKCFLFYVQHCPSPTQLAISGAFTMIFSYMASYYCTTKLMHWAIAPKFEAQSNEFKDKKHRKPRKVKGGKKSKWYRSTDYDDQYYEGQGRAHDSQYLGKIRGNMARLECAFVFGDYIRRESQNIAFVTGNAAVGTAHLLYNFQDCDKAASYVTLRTATLNKKIWVKDIEWLTPDEKCGMDVGMIVFRDKAINRPDIVNRFVKESDIENVRVNECTLSKIVPSGHNTFVCADRDMENCTFEHNSPIYNSIDDEYSITDYLKYRCFTERGDCGSVITHNDASIEGAIIGIHVAGRPNSNDGLGQVVTRDMIMEMLDTMDIKFRRKAIVETHPVEADDIASYAAYGEIDVIGKLDIRDAVRMPDKTSLRPSLVHDVFQESTHAPAMLRKTNGISPVHVALNKANVPEGNFDTARFRECEEHMNNIRKSLPTHGMDRVLTDKEAVNGIKGTNLLKPINIHTSPGYPYVLHRKCKGKQDWLKMVESDEEGPVIHMTKSFMEEFHAMEEQIFQGDIPMFPFISCLKDEKRPKEKVEMGKTRLFSVGNQLHLLLSRKYFGGYVAFLTANRNVLPSKVGLVMNGVEFHDFYQYMVKGRTQSEAMNNANDGDFSGFDDSLMPELIRSFFESGRNWYAFHRKADDIEFERHDTIRRNLIETFMGPPHLMGNIMYSLCKANSSGSFATVHINGHANELAHRYVFCELGEEHGMDNVDFDNHVNLATYGDDSVMVLSDEVKDFYNGMTLAPIFRGAFGMTYTTATKGTAETPVRPLSEIDFCKRKFVYRPEIRKMVGQMEITNILEITNWIKDSPDANHSTLENVESAHRELIFHGEKVYNEYAQKFVDGCARAGLCYKPRNYRYWQNKYYKNEL